MCVFNLLPLQQDPQCRTEFLAFSFQQCASLILMGELSPPSLSKDLLLSEIHAARSRHSPERVNIIKLPRRAAEAFQICPTTLAAAESPL